MATTMLSNNSESPRSTPPSFHTGSDSIDGDRLARMGYKPELKRNLSIWSLLGLGFSVSNSWWGASASLAAGILSGGPVLMIYGIIFISLVAACIGSSLAELASAMPNSGGQYYWASQLSPRKHAPFLAFLTGGLNWAGAIFASSSVALSLATSFVGLYVLGHPGFIPAPWMTFLAYQLINIFAMFFNCFHSILPPVSLFCLYISILGCVVTTIVVPAVSQTKQPASFVFAKFINETGWTNDAIAFIVGLISPAWCFGALDVATHLAEEIHQPERMIPKSILCTVLVGVVSAVAYCIAMFFSLSDYTSVVNSPTGVPILELYYQSMRQSFAGAAVLQVIFILTGFGCFVACHTWQARLAWSFSRDGGLPGSKIWSIVHPKAGVPINAHLMSCTCVGILGCLHLASTTAFNSIITGCITFLYLSYSIPVACLLFRKRSTFEHGPFWLGRLGLIANVVLLGWTLFSLVVFSFPFVMPVTPGNMNYVSVVIVGYIAYLCAYWWLGGRRFFRVPGMDMKQSVKDSHHTKTHEYSR